MTPLFDATATLPYYRAIYAVDRPKLAFNAWVIKSPWLTIHDENLDGKIDRTDFVLWTWAMWNGFLSPAARAWRMTL